MVVTEPGSKERTSEPNNRLKTKVDHWKMLLQKDGGYISNYSM